MLQFPLLSTDQAWLKLFQRIEVLAEVLRLLPVTPALKQHVFHQQRLKSSLFSARIEGNLLTWDAVYDHSLNTSQNKSHQEISNVVAALQALSGLTGGFDQKKLLEIHRQIMASLDAGAGKFRYEPTAIYDQHGTLVYLTPMPAEMHQMLTVWLAKINAIPTLPWQDQLLQIIAGHYYFEKIHPFVDGNGRTGRVVLHYQLNRMGLFSDLIMPIDQYFDEHRSNYYALLEKNTRRIHDFCEFFLHGIIWALESCLDDLKKGALAGASENTVLSQSKPDFRSLFPRRKELYYLIQDHPFITLESLARRFPTIPPRTLAYDVNQLVKTGLVIKHGTTKGVMYSVEKEPSL